MEALFVVLQIYFGSVDNYSCDNIKEFASQGRNRGYANPQSGHISGVGWKSGSSGVEVGNGEWGMNTNFSFYLLKRSLNVILLVMTSLVSSSFA